MATRLASFAPSTSTPSSSAGGVTFEAVMVQLQCMDAYLNTLNTEMYQVNTHIGHIAWQQAYLSGFVESPSPSLEAFEDDDDDGDSDGGDAGKDKDASFFSDDEMTAS